MAVRTDLQKRRPRPGGLGDLGRGSLKSIKLRKKKEQIERIRAIVDKMDKENVEKFPSMPAFRKTLKRSVRQGASTGISDPSIKIKFKKRRKKLMLKELE